jgi:hypothetical protein
MNCKIIKESKENKKNIIDYMVHVSKDKLDSMNDREKIKEIESIVDEVEFAFRTKNMEIFTMKINDEIHGIIYAQLPDKDGIQYISIYYAYVDAGFRKTKCAAKLFYMLFNVIGSGLGLVIEHDRWKINIKGIRDMRDIMGMCVISQEYRTRLARIFEGR